MITDADITKLKGVFATNEVVDELRMDMEARFDGVDRRFDGIDEKMDTLAGAIAQIQNSIDGFTGAVHTQQMENAAGAIHLARHDRQIEALALATHVALPD